MVETGKPSIREYADWLRATHGVAADSRLEKYYGIVSQDIKESFQNSTFWSELAGRWREIDQEFYVETGYQLFADEEPPRLLVKPYDSFLLKTYRHNIQSNSSWPMAPDWGWLVPGTGWFSRVHDIARTTVVVKYFDGVRFAVSRLASIAESHSLQYDLTWEAREEGYYAAHFVLEDEVEIPCQTWDTEFIKAHFEIQVTTQIQEVIRTLLHRYYERARANPAVCPVNTWRWDYQADEFISSYLGHILHYVEGMIVEIREKQKG